MARYNLVKLRKSQNMNQRELAQRLNMTQSFLSAIENGKSPLPLEKEARLADIFPDSNLSDFLIEEPAAEEGPQKGLAMLSESDLLNQLLSRFHDHAHKHDEMEHHTSDASRVEALESRIDKLLDRNERLLEHNEALNRMVEDLRREVNRLNSMLNDKASAPSINDF